MLGSAVWLETDRDTCLSRRAQRSGRQGHEGFSTWYKDVVWTHFLKNRDTQLANARDACNVLILSDIGKMTSEELVNHAIGALKVQPQQQAAKEGSPVSCRAQCLQDGQETLIIAKLAELQYTRQRLLCRIDVQLDPVVVLLHFAQCTVGLRQRRTLRFAQCAVRLRQCSDISPVVLKKTTSIYHRAFSDSLH
eukprot:6463945-Amphidinium_carterae.1